MLAMVSVQPTHATGQGSLNWPGYLFDSGHSSYTAGATTISPSNAANLAVAWDFRVPPATMPGQPGAQLDASPTVYDGSVYIGANTGVFYKLSETSGTIEAKTFLGFTQRGVCGSRGITSM